MSTRRAAEGAALHDNRYMSDPDFVEMRGISGSAVAAKASFISERKRSALLFFIQSLSIEQRGTHALAAALLENFSDRIGTPSMRDFGIKPGQKYSAEQVRQVRKELGFAIPAGIAGSCAEKRYWKREFPLRDDVDHDEDEDSQYIFAERDLQEERAASTKRPTTYPAELFLKICREHVARALPEFLVELCVNPRLEVVAAAETGGVAQIDREEVTTRWTSEIKWEDCGPARLSGFHDIVGAIFDYQRQYEEQARENFAMTTIGRKVFGALDYCLKTQSMVLVEGGSGVGKSENQVAWCDQHRGVARYVKLKGINTKRGFFGAIAKSLGVGHTANLSPEKVQARIERFLEVSGLMLVIDEAQYCWPQGRRIYKEPEYINWLNTACANEGIPVALVATEDFSARRRAVEAQTSWNSIQLRRRLRQVFTLPSIPTNDDLALVTRKLLPYGTEAMVNLIVGYALTSKGYMQAVVDAIDDARLIAEEAGRERIGAGDLKRSISECRAPSDAAQKRLFAPEEKRRRTTGRPSQYGRTTHDGGGAAANPQRPGSDAADNDFSSDESASTNRLSGHELAET